MTVFVCGLYAISIHTPLAGSDCGVEPLWRVAYPISIHTPLAGSDVRTQVQSQHQKYFNPHSPCGERLEYQRKDMIHVYFNPHSPCGERHAARDSRFEQVISIHTPLAGSDEYTLSSSSTEPISIHTPLAGSDAHEVTYLVVVVISIHTPLAGSDPAVWVSIIATLLFQSTLPLRGATHRTAIALGRNHISIHTPLAGSDSLMPSCIIAWLFQSTLPLRGATHTERNGSLLTLFQSTLPLRGATVALRRDGVIQEHFNPHSPCGERLQQILDKANALLISIHTPLAGSDFSWAEWTPNTTLFQSTLPLRGATRTPTRSRRRGRYFNPHSPCGERRGLSGSCDGDSISIHTPLAGSD